MKKNREWKVLLAAVVLIFMSLFDAQASTRDGKTYKILDKVHKVYEPSSGPQVSFQLSASMYRVKDAQQLKTLKNHLKKKSYLQVEFNTLTKEIVSVKEIK